MQSTQLPAPGLITSQLIGASSSIIVCNNDIVASNVYQQLSFFGVKKESLLYLPDTEILPYDFDSPHPDVLSRRASVLNQLCNAAEGAVLVVSAPTLLRRVASRAHWTRVITISVGDIIDPSALREDLTNIGYREQEIELSEHGDFIIKTQVIDIYPSGPSTPVRIRLNGNKKATNIEKINLNNQLSSGSVDSVSAMPSSEFPIDEESIARFKKSYLSTFERGYFDPIYKSVIQREMPNGVEFLLPFFTETSSIIEIFRESSASLNFIFLPEAMSRLNDAYRHIGSRYNDVSLDPDRRLIPPEKLWISPDDVMSAANKADCFIDLSKIGHNINVSHHQIARQLTLQETVDTLVEPISQASKVLFCMNSVDRVDQLEVVCDLLGVEPQPIHHWHEFLEGEQKFSIIIGKINQGFWLNSSLLIITEQDILGEKIFVQNEDRQEKGRTFEQIQDLQNLEVGDPVVHVEYGVGRFLGLEKMELNDRLQEFLTIEYAESAKAYVNMDDLHLVSRYGGIAMSDTPIDAMGSPRWRQNLEIAVHEIRDTAKNLLKLESARANRRGISMKRPSGTYHRFVKDFPFEETGDQKKAIQDVIEDLISQKPMDRTVVGDVGFGKTEVALRAAFLAVESGFQVAVMVPTTLLAQQHYESFKSRLEKYGKKVVLLSRLDRDFEKKHLYNIKSGDADVVIGTHRVIQSDVEFRSLGLLIVDEEHRFGVQHKSKLSQLRESLNVLCLTATPIPRTLGMSLQGVRDLSIISTAPSKRLSIRTFVSEKNDRSIAEAMERELMRDGQIFYLHNRTEDLPQRVSELKALAPTARIRYAHGQMGELELTGIMRDFYEHKFDVLVCTTIIEIGIDIPNANTILIEKANTFGLAQLHQLRGRVGRSHHQGYAYLMIDNMDEVSESGKKRLYAMQKASRLGDGFLIANHDLEIRGAGEILGDEQSGHIRNIGFSLYMRLLNNALVMLKKGIEPSDINDFEATLEVEIGLPGIIDDSYITSDRMRLSLYKRFSDLEESARLAKIQSDVENRFGQMPKETHDLLILSGLRCYLRSLGVKKVMADDHHLVMEVRPNPKLQMQKMIDMVNEYGDAISLLSPTKFSLDIHMPTIKDRIDVVSEVIDEFRVT